MKTCLAGLTSVAAVAFALALGAAGCGSNDGGDFVANGDCRQASWACTDGYTCVEAAGVWECVPDDGKDAVGGGGSPDVDIPSDTGPETDSETEGGGPDSIDPPPDTTDPVDTVDPIDTDDDVDASEPSDTEEDADTAEPDGDDADAEEPCLPLGIALKLPGTVLSGLAQIDVEISGGCGVLGVEFQVDGQTLATDVIPPYKTAINTSLFKDGPHAVSVFTADASGQTAQDTKNVVFDNSPPQIIAVSPTADATVFFEDGPLELAAEVDDAGSIAVVTFRANGLLVGEFANPPFKATIEWDSLFVTEEALPKTLFLQFSAKDTLGQETVVSHNIEVHQRFRWEFPTLGEIWGDAGVLPNGNIVFPTLNNDMYCMTPEGGQVWNFKTQGGVLPGPAINPSNGQIYFGTQEGKIYGLSSGGSQQWTQDIGNPLGSSIAYANGTIAVAAFNGVLTLRNSSNGGTLWTASLPGNINSRPAVTDDGTVYVGCDDKSLYAYNGGSLQWSVPTAGEVWSGPVVGLNGAVYFGSNDGWVYAVKKNGQPLWDVKVNGQIWGKPWFGQDNSIYVASTSKYVTKLDAIDGTEIWSTKLEGMTYSSPVVDEPADTLYVGTTVGVVFALDTEDGKVRFDYTVSDTIHASVLVAGDAIYFGSKDRSLYSLWKYGASLSGGP
jgi:outer membrane protein assembly factor BamB